MSLCICSVLGMIGVDVGARTCKYWISSDCQAFIMAMSDDGNCVSYQDAVDFSTEVSAIVPERSLVFSFCHNPIGALMGYVAFLSKSIVTLLLSADLDKQLIKELMEKYKPNYFWIPKNMDIGGIAKVMKLLYWKLVLRNAFWKM